MYIVNFFCFLYCVEYTRVLVYNFFLEHFIVLFKQIIMSSCVFIMKTNLKMTLLLYQLKL